MRKGKTPPTTKWHRPGSGYQQEHGDASWKPGDRVPRTKPPAEATAQSPGLTPGLPWEDGSPEQSTAPCHRLQPPQDRQHSPSSPSRAPLHTQAHFSFSYFFGLVFIFLLSPIPPVTPSRAADYKRGSLTPAIGLLH